jgi:hypothetical protein
MKALYIFSILLVLTLSDAYAQYQKKVTIRVQAGYANPSGESLRDDLQPFFFSNLGFGAGAGFAAQYNTKGLLSYGGQVTTASFFNLSAIEDEDISFEGNSYFQINTINAFIKARFLQNFVVSPYAFGGPHIAYYYGERAGQETVISDYFVLDPTFEFGNPFLSIDEVIINESSQQVDDVISWGFNAGVGLEADISQTFGIFLEGKYVFTYAANEELLRQNLAYGEVSLGLSINLFRSKTR